jgi:hypothetical protein
MSFEIEDTRTVVISWCLCNAGTNTPPFGYLLNNLQFQPDFIRLEQFTTNTSVATGNIYVVTSNLTNEALLTFSGRQNFPVNMSLTFAMKKPINQLTFQTQMLNTDNTIIDANYGGGATVYISITLTLIRIKKYHNDNIKNADNRIGLVPH